jgi:hypothetical protein
MTVETLHARVVGQWGVIESSRLEGNMCFCVVRHE